MKLRFARLLIVLVAGWWVVGLRAQTPAPAVGAAQVTGPQVVSIAGELELDGEIRVGVKGLAAWVATNDPMKLVPFINGRAIRGVYPEGVHVVEEHVHFELCSTPENRAVWNSLLGEPSGFYKPVDFSVGLEGQSPFPTVFRDTRQSRLTIIPPVYGWISLGVVLAAASALIWLARHTRMIRDEGTAGKLGPYNLGRAQMAFWFFLTISSYIAIWLITGAIDTITPSLLGLMGISAGTALSEVLIDTNKESAAAANAQAGAAEKQALEQSVAALQAQLAATIVGSADAAAVRDNLNRQLLEQRTRLNLLAQQAASLASGDGGSVSCGFLRDVLSDGRGYSFHRFQIFAWTIVLGGIFVVAVYNTLTMPEFSATTLGLMGVSSGTYVGFKFPEQR